ncbi:MAG: hypothetical protein WDO19_22710 [Bacteroidota bacterium]
MIPTLGLDEGDELNIQCSILNKKGSATLALTQFENGMEIYRKINFSEISNEKSEYLKKEFITLRLLPARFLVKMPNLCWIEYPLPQVIPLLKQLFMLLLTQSRLK